MALGEQLRRYTGMTARADVVSALTVATVTVPQAMAYALLAGMPAVTGLWAAIVASFVYAWCGSSRYLAIGPVALTCLLVASGLEPLAPAMSDEYIELAVLLAGMVAALLLVLGAVRAGFLVNFLGHPTILGFNAAAGLLTALSQLRPILGIERGAVAGVTAENPWPLLGHLELTQWVSLTTGLVAVAVLFVLTRRFPKVPAALVVCVLGGVAAAAFDLPAKGLGVVGDIPAGFPAVSFPKGVSLERLRTLLPTAISVVVVGYGSSMAVAKALAAKDRESIRPNRELWAMGLANAAVSFIGAFPVTGGLSRTIVVARSGGRTQLAGLGSGLIVLAAVLLIGPILKYLPLPVLAGIIILAALSLIDIPEIRRVFAIKRVDGITVVLTFATTMTIGLVEGLATGLLVALVFFVYRTAVPHSAELGRIPGSMVYRNTQRFSVETCPQVGILRVDAPLYYANSRFLEDRITRMFAERSQMQVIVLECSSVGDMDATALQSLRHVVLNLRARDNDLHLVGAIGPVRDILETSGFIELLGEQNMHRTILEAAPTLMRSIARGFCESQCKAAAFPDCTLIPRDRVRSTDGEKAKFSAQI